MAALRERGIYEAALLDAFIGVRTNHFNWSISTIECMFRIADKIKLLEAGSPLPDGDRFTVFRGVSGLGHYRRVTGFSWTLSLPRACWFATRLHFEDPAGYSAQVHRERVLAYYNGRLEQELVCRPGRPRRLQMSLDEMRIENKYLLMRCGRRSTATRRPSGFGLGIWPVHHFAFDVHDRHVQLGVGLNC